MRQKLGVLVVVALVAAGGACFDFGSLGDSADGGTDSAPTETGPCAPSQKVCVGACYGQSDPSVGCSGECTACVAPPHAQAACALSSGSEACSMGACNPQYGDCDLTSADGCETHTTTSAHCGSCGTDCLQDYCEYQSGGYVCSATCDVPNVICEDDAGVECADLQTDNEHCGNCQISCAVSNGSGTCKTGICDISCSSNYFLCNGACSLPSDFSCGASCLPCSVGNTCDTSIGSPTYGQCVLSTEGQQACTDKQCKLADGGCVTVDMTTSPNCGGCGVDCKSVGKQCCTGDGKSACTVPAPVGDAGVFDSGGSDSGGSDSGTHDAGPSCRN
ncbi:MAG: hypothetical protein ACRELY_06520 [Polyangiaceae bacterium]